MRTFESFVHGSETAGEKSDGVAGADEHQLAHEEVFEIDEFFVVGDDLVGLLLEGEPDGQAKAGLRPSAAMTRGHDAAARAGDDHPTRGGHFLGEFGGMAIVLMGFGGSGAAEDADLSHVAVRGEDFQGVAEFLERLVDELDVAAIGLIAEEFHGVVDDFADHVAVGDVAELLDELLGEMVNAGQIGAAHDNGRLGGLLGFL